MKISHDQAIDATGAMLRGMRRAYVETYPGKPCPIVEWNELPRLARLVFMKSMTSGLITLGITIDATSEAAPLRASE